MTNKQIAFQTAVQNIIPKLQRRNMEGFFFEDSSSCIKAIMDLIPEPSVLSWGGSETLTETGLMEVLRNSRHTLIDRATANTMDEKRGIFAKTVLSDYYFMSTNAITLEGELINIDGFGNRVACLIHGPKYVFILVGMNKLVTDIKSGIDRIRNFAAPPNVVRLNKQTPCHMNGRCGDCYGDDSICSHLVITRRSGIKDRIKIFFIAEELGY